MEEAYNELYQQFLHLRSLCLRQAALLHQLTTTQQRQQGPHESYQSPNAFEYASYDFQYLKYSLPAGATIPNGVINDAKDIPEYLQGKFELSFGAAECGVNGISGNIGTIADPLSMDMSQLSVNGTCQKNENRELAQNIAPLQSLDHLGVQGASSKVSENYYQADHHSGGRMRVVVFTWQKFHLFSSLSLDFTRTQVSSFLSALRCP